MPREPHLVVVDGAHGVAKCSAVLNESDPMDMLVKLYDLPKSCAVFERLGEQGIHIRRALAAEKHKIAAWVREDFAEGWASETEIAFGRQPISCFVAVREMPAMTRHFVISLAQPV